MAGIVNEASTVFVISQGDPRNRMKLTSLSDVTLQMHFPCCRKR